MITLPSLSIIVVVNADRANGPPRRSTQLSFFLFRQWINHGVYRLDRLSNLFRLLYHVIIIESVVTITTASSRRTSARAAPPRRRRFTCHPRRRLFCCFLFFSFWGPEIFG